jgi:regulator of chromosome condensation
MINILRPRTNHRDSLWFFGSFEADQIGFDPEDEDISPLTDAQKYDGVVKNPLKMSMFPKEVIVSVVCGGMHSLVLTASGAVYAWGVNDCGELGRQGSSSYIEMVTMPGPVSQISCGENHSLALLSNDRCDVYYWGAYRNVTSRQTEGGLLWPAAFAPTLIEHSYFRGCRPFKLSSGLNHSLILGADQKFKFHVFGLGDDSIGKLASGITKRFDHCRPVELKLQNPLDVWAVGSSSFYLRSSQIMKLYGWGYNMEHTLGLGHSKTPIVKPVKIDFFTGKHVIDIQGGEFFAIFMTTKSQVYACGKNECGETGTGILEKKSVEVPHLINLPGDIIKIGAGAHTGFAISKQGKAFTWGEGSNFLLGNQSEDNVFTPHEVDLALFNDDLIVDVRPIQLAIGGQHSLFVTTPRESFESPSMKRKSESRASSERRRSVIHIN